MRIALQRHREVVLFLCMKAPIFIILYSFLYTNTLLGQFRVPVQVDGTQKVKNTERLKLKTTEAVTI
ncbi:MAG: hypothetical protein OXC67_11575 [Flavobacteriaceae bacterium]|nr:hypothetical protein [Flavobacteriaceae bacterium]